MSPEGVLDDLELEMATAVAAYRVKRVLREKLGVGHGDKRPPTFDTHQIGAMAEIAFAKHYGFYWGGGCDDFGMTGGGDVAGYEVRGTGWPNGHLLVYETDDPGKVAVLVVLDGWKRGADPLRFRIVGGLPIAECQTDQYLNRDKSWGHGAGVGDKRLWKVPQRDLRPL